MSTLRKPCSAKSRNSCSKRPSEPRGEVSASLYLLDELERVLTEKLGFSRRLAYLSRRRIIRRAKLFEPGASHHAVPQDPADSPILRAALAAGADYLVTNDVHLLALDPCEGLRIISMDEYYGLLRDEGYLRS